MFDAVCYAGGVLRSKIADSRNAETRRAVRPPELLNRVGAGDRKKRNG